MVELHTAEPHRIGDKLVDCRWMAQSRVYHGPRRGRNAGEIPTFYGRRKDEAVQRLVRYAFYGEEGTDE